MNFLLALLLLLSVMLTSCVNSNGLNILRRDRSKPDEYYSSMNQGGQLATSYLGTPYGKYQIIGGFIYYSQYGNTEFTKLCIKTDCDHMYSKCDAFVVDNTRIGYYKGKIYFTEFANDLTLKLLYMDMDGRNREVLKPITTDIPMATSMNDGCFHDGYYYFLVTEGGGIGNIGNKDDNLYRIKLDSKSEYEKVFNDDVISEISMFTIVEDNVFFYLNKTGINPNDYYNLKTDYIDFDLYMLSLKDNEFQHMTDKWVDYTNCYYDSDKGYCYKHNDGFYTLDLATKEITKTADFKVEIGWRSTTHYYTDNIYVITYENIKGDQGYDQPAKSQTLYIFDRQYKLLDTFTTEVKQAPVGCMMEDTGDYIVISTDYRKPADYYIDKSEIGTGNLMFHKIED